jgi:hypothetical protein
MTSHIHQKGVDTFVCTHCHTNKTSRCALCKDRICTTHHVKVQGYAPEGAVAMCQSCAKYIDTIVSPKYSQ